MFATPTSYCVTPTRPRPLMRLPERATTFLRDVKRRSLRVKRSKSMVISTPEKRKSDTFVKLDEDEVRKKYIDEVNKNYQTKPGLAGKLPQTPKEEIKDQLEFKPTTTGCHCECHRGLHPGTPLLQRSTPSFLPSPSSTISTIYTPRTSTATLDLDQSTKIVITPHIDGNISTGYFRKLNSPSWQDQGNKENEEPSWQTPVPLSPCLVRRSTRRSNLFTPKAKKLEATPSMKTKKPGDELGEGRMIPIKQGYLYKKSGSSRMYRRKYVTLCSDGSMTYYPSFQAYVDNVNGKEILLQYVTVKIPGQKPCGLKSSTAEKRQSGGNVSSCSSDEFDKETLLLMGCEKLDEKVEEAVEGRSTVQRKNSKRRRHRLSEDNEGSGSFELVIVSLDNRSWQFELCSKEEGEDWVLAIQHQIHRSLQGTAATPPRHASQLEHIKTNVAGNAVCVDCGGKKPAWASLNLGVLICIECSGIHRNHGSHVSRVRSLDLDSWPPAHIAVMRSLGNAMANDIWEARMGKGRKPQPTASRKQKEDYFKSKYINKEFLDPIPEETSISDHLVKAILESNMRSLCHALAHSTSSDVNSDKNQERKSALHIATIQSNLPSTQLLLWYKADVDKTDEDGRSCIDIARQMKGSNSQEICDLLLSSHTNTSSPSAKLCQESKLL